MAPAVPIRFGCFGAAVFLDGELASERRIGAAAVPDEDELSLPGPAAVRPKQAVGTVGDGRLHRVPFDAGNEVVAGEPHAARDRHPSDFVMFGSDGLVRAEFPCRGNQTVDRGVRFEWLRSRAVDDSGATGCGSRLDLGTDHRLVVRVPSRTAPAVRR